MSHFIHLLLNVSGGDTMEHSALAAIEFGNAKYKDCKWI